MMRRTVKLQLIAFAILSAVLVVYAGLSLIGLDKVIFGNTYTVRANFAETGGIFTNADVTYRGYKIGKVTGIDLTEKGIQLDLRLDDTYQVPSDLAAVIANGSAIGQQYVDLQPRTEKGPFLTSKSVIAQGDTSTPPTTTELLTNLDDLVNSVGKQDLATTITELGNAFDGTGPTLARLIDSGNSLTDAATANLPDTTRLIQDGVPVLETQRAVRSDLQTWADQLAQFSQQLRTSDPDLGAVLSNGIGSSQQLQALLAENEQTLPTFLGNLTTLGQIQAARLPQIETILVAYPLNIAAGFTVVPGDGTSHFGLVTTMDPPPCTAGYESTRTRPGTDTSARPANVLVDCAAPKGQQPAIRGGRDAPRPAGDDTDQFGGSSFPAGEGAPQPPDSQPSSSSGAPGTANSAATGTGTTSTVPYVTDSGTGLGTVTTTDGITYTLRQPRDVSALGSQSWKWMLLAPLVD